MTTTRIDVAAVGQRALHTRAIPVARARWIAIVFVATAAVVGACTTAYDPPVLPAHGERYQVAPSPPDGKARIVVYVDGSVWPDRPQERIRINRVEVARLALLGRQLRETGLPRTDPETRYCEFVSVEVAAGPTEIQAEFSLRLEEFNGNPFSSTTVPPTGIRFEATEGRTYFVLVLEEWRRSNMNGHRISVVPQVFADQRLQQCFRTID